MEIEVACNTSDEVMFANIRENSAGRDWLASAEPHDGHAVIVGGGPSLDDYLPRLLQRRDAGQTIFALNGACGWLNRHDIVPNWQVIMDARKENVRFIAEADGHLFASQCAPVMFEKVPGARLWHPAIEGIQEHLDDAPGPYALIGGGTTVGLTAMCLAYAMGYRKLHLFGFDCSYREGRGHAYPQRSDGPCKVTLGGQTFTSTLAMVRQAEQFPTVCDTLIDLGCTITVECDGLILVAMAEAQKKDD